MDRLALTAYVALLVFFWLKYAALVAVQRNRRMASKLFRWPEDAAAFGGAPANGPEDALVERAQRAIDNDGESQPLFLASAATWIALGAGGTWAIAAFSTYAITRALHAWLLLYPRQPARTRIFGLSQAILIALLADSVRRSF